MKRLISFIKENKEYIFYILMCIPAIVAFFMFIVQQWKEIVFNIAITEQEMNIMYFFVVLGIYTMGITLAIMTAKGEGK